MKRGMVSCVNDLMSARESYPPPTFSEDLQPVFKIMMIRHDIESDRTYQ